MKAKIVRVISILMGVTIFIGAASQPADALASEPQNGSEKGTAQSAELFEPQELEAFMDGLLQATMAENHVAGAVVAVVGDGRTLLSKGYGFADLEAKTPVEAQRTLFRVASLSKLFTWTAVMQLLEQDKLSLDVDVNEYLDFEIPSTFPEPITLRHLLSHTPGFEDKGLGMNKLQAEKMMPLGDFLKANLPARVFPPGEVIAYSNYGAALAGHIVERISGLPFDEYVEQHIFAPLGMTRSTFRQPLPASLAPDLTTGYNYTGGQYVAGSFVFVLPFPEGAMSATAGDMARFMIAHLQYGELDGQRILQEETARQMHGQLYTADPRLDGWAHGFAENTINGQRILSHGGNLPPFQSGLYLIPGQNVGLFIAANSTGGAAAIQSIVTAFLDRYYPAEESPGSQSTAGFPERIAPYLGEYTGARSNFTSLERTMELTRPINVSLDSDNCLILSSSGRVVRFAEIEPGLLQEINKPANRAVYRPGPDGRLTLTGTLGVREPFAVIKTPWYGTSSLHRLLFLSGSLLFLGALMAWPIGYVSRRRKQPVGSNPTPLPARLARWAAALFGLLWLVFLLGLASIFADILPGFGYPRIFFENPPQLDILTPLSILLGGLGLAMLVFSVLAWARRWWGLGGRIFYSLLALAGLLLTWALVYWNVIP